MMIEKIFHITAVTVYILTLSALGLYGLNFLYLTAIAGKNRRYLPKYFLDVPLPKVTVQLPIFNEYNVVERIINAAARLDWPSDLFEIQVLDDSTDATCDLARQAVAYWHARGVHIQHIHRKNREGYKSGALANGLLTSTGEFIAIFDADFIPEPDFLYKTIGAFSNPDVGCVQARWTHINGDSSLLTCLQRLGIDGHFMIEQFARAYAGFVMNFNGTGGVWSRTAIEDVGGWNFKSITEDLDLSYRSALKGWKMVYLPNVPVPSELVPSLLAYRRQQRRW